jgi:hypothetical protein
LRSLGGRLGSGWVYKQVKTQVDFFFFSTGV